MKLLFIPLLPGNPETDDLYKAFCKKYEVHFYTSINPAINFDPDIVYIHSGALSLEVVQVLKDCTKAIWTQWTGDCAEGHLLEPVLRYKSICDVTFLACGAGLKKEYEKELGHPVHWLPHAVADWQFRPVNPDAKGIVFVGNNYTHFSGGVERKELNDLLRERADFTLYGSGWNGANSHLQKFPESHPVKWESLPDIYNNAYIGLSNNLINNVPLYFSNRPLNVMAAGSICLMRYVPGIEEYFTHGYDCLIYHDIDQAISEIKYWHEATTQARNAIAENGQNVVRRFFMYENIVEMFNKAL